MEWRRLWLKSKTQLTIITNEAQVINEIKAPKRKIKVKIEKKPRWERGEKIIRDFAIIAHEKASLVAPVCRRW